MLGFSPIRAGVEEVPRRPSFFYCSKSDIILPKLFPSGNKSGNGKVKSLIYQGFPRFISGVQVPSPALFHAFRKYKENRVNTGLEGSHS